MEKLSLEQLASYLPYELQVKANDTVTPGVLVSICSGMAGLLLYEEKDEIEYYDLSEIKPLLIPLSECEKHLNVDSGLEIDSSILTFNKYCNSINIYPDGSEWTHSIDVYNNIYVWLFKNHFDVFNLISKGLALNKLEYGN